MNNFPNHKQHPPEFNPSVPPPSIAGQPYYPTSFNSPSAPVGYQSAVSSFVSKSFYSSSKPSTHPSRCSSFNLPPFSSTTQPNSNEPNSFFNIPPPCVLPSHCSESQTNSVPIHRPYYSFPHNPQSNSYQSHYQTYPPQTPFPNQYRQRYYPPPSYSQEPYKNSSSGNNASVLHSVQKDTNKCAKEIEDRSRFETYRKEIEGRCWNPSINKNVPPEKTSDFSKHSLYKKQYYSKQHKPFPQSSKHLSSNSKSSRPTSFNSRDSSSDSENSRSKSHRSLPSRSRSTSCFQNDRDYRSSSVTSISSHKFNRSSSAKPFSSYGKNSLSNENDSKHQKRVETERDKLLKTYRSQFCETSEEITKKLAELANNEEKEIWIRSSPAELFYRRTNNGNEVESTPRLDALCKLFDEKLVKRAEKIKSAQEPYKAPERKRKTRLCKHKSEKCSSESSEDEDDETEEDCSMEELKKKMSHPYRLHPDLWHNEPGEMNDGPLCRCSAKSRRTGIRHGIYPGEIGFPKCKLNGNNANKLYHYRITISPPTNFLTKTPTMIKYDQHEFLFEGFSLLSHAPIDELPTCKVIRFNIEYRILYIEEKMPEHFTINELDLFFKYLFHELLELIDFNLMPSLGSEETSCSCFHFLPRFVRDLEDNGKEVLAMSEVLKYLLDCSGSLVDRQTLEGMMKMSQNEWQDYVDYIKGMIVTNPGHVPCSVRVDQLDRNVSDLEECIDKDEDGIVHPVIVHFGIRPPQLSYAGNPEYQKARREYVRFRHLLANMSKPTYEDKRKLEDKENELQRMRTQGRMKRNITVAISSKGFYRTGIMCDIVQHALLIPVLTTHLRFHQSLDYLEKLIDFKFHNRYLLQLALTHPSYKENFGTNPDHARNSLTNCGIRQPEYGDRKIHYMNTRKRGINTLINIMSRFGKEHETASNITHNERLEFLGDAVVEFLSSIHLFFMFPDLEEGGLATYRAAIVQNQHLAVLAKKFHLDEFMLYAHGSDLCHELELRHAMANCFEALMGALLLDGGITVADKVFANALFMDNPNLKDVWENYPPHPLQDQEPLGDRKWIESYQILKDLTKFEESIGVKFKHIRLLARAFTDRSIGFTHLTLGSNQRLEFLGDTVLQLICSEYLYRHFPEHHEGHLSLLRSSLVNNRTQAVVCDDLGMTKYAVYSNPRAELKTKDRADLLEAFLGALYVDKGLEYCQTFCQVCLFPRLQLFIMNQDWNDPKSKLQQCCLTLRTMEGGEPDIPYYKVIQSIGPTNTRVYTVAVYFRNKRLATAEGHSIQQAEMHAAKQALENSRELFPQLDHQKRVIVQSIKRQKGNENGITDDLIKEAEQTLQAKAMRKLVNSCDLDESHLPKQYRMREDISSDEFSFDSDDNDDSLQTIQNNSTSQAVNIKKQKRNRSREQQRKKRIRSSSKAKSSEALESIDYEDDDNEDDDDDDDDDDDFRSSIYNDLSPLSDNDIIFIEDSNKTSHDKNKTKDESKDNKLSDKTCSSTINEGSFDKDVLCYKIEGTEELSSDVESGEII